MKDFLEIGFGGVGICWVREEKKLETNLLFRDWGKKDWGLKSCSVTS